MSIFSRNLSYHWNVRVQKKKKFYENFFYNILEIYNISIQVRLTTSKTKLDIQYSKLCIRVDSGVAKQLKTEYLRKLGKNKKISNFHGHKS